MSSYGDFVSRGNARGIDLYSNTLQFNGCGLPGERVKRNLTKTFRLGSMNIDTWNEYASSSHQGERKKNPNCGWVLRIYMLLIIPLPICLTGFRPVIEKMRPVAEIAMVAHIMGSACIVILNSSRYWLTPFAREQSDQCSDLMIISFG